MKFIINSFFVISLGLLFFTEAYAQEPEYNVSMRIALTGGRRTTSCINNIDLFFLANSRTVCHLGTAGFDYYYNENVGSIKKSELATANRLVLNETNYGWFSNAAESGGGHCYGNAQSANVGGLFSNYLSTSYWTNNYPILEYAGLSSITFYPKNLYIQNVSGPENGTVLSQNDLTTVSSTADFPADAYTWKYQIVDGVSGWVDLPSQYQGKSSISFTGNDLLGSASFANVVNASRLINIAIYYKGADGKLTFDPSNIKSLIPKFNAPKIVSVAVQKAKCSTSLTTSVKVKLDKNIGVNKQLEIVFKDPSIDGNETILITDDSLNSNLEYEYQLTPIDRNYSVYLNGYNEFKNAIWVGASSYYLDRAPVLYSTSHTLPPPLQAQLSKTGIFCNGGSDGIINAQVQGGTSPYTLRYISSSNVELANHTFPNTDVNKWLADAVPVNNASAGTYTLEIQDKNACPLSSSITLTQPSNPLAISTRTYTEVSGYGLSNGAFEVNLTGGTTALPQGYPAPSLVNSNNTLYTASFVSTQNNEYTYRFNNLPAGDYHFRSEDAALTPNKVNIRDSAGCMVKELTTIIQPAPLLVSFEKTKAVTCFGGQDGAFTVHATGGKRFVTGMPYTYTWSYSADGIVAYSNLSFSDSNYTAAKAGFYKVSVQDKNNNITTGIYELTQPPKIDFDATVKNVTCLNWTDGAITLSNVRGGTAPYEVLWYNGSKAYEVTDLGHGYFNVIVSDVLGCSTSKNIQVKDTLNGITLTQGISVMPYCYGDANGALSVEVQVERPPYTVHWNTGSTNELLSSIPSGVYTVQVLNSNNCLKEKTFVLENPNPIPLNLDATRYLCVDQTADYDIEVVDSVYQYQWQGPSLNTNETKVSLSDEGVYTASITDSKGCKAEKTVEIFHINKTIACEFVVPTEVYVGDEVSLVNITEVTQADGAEWNFYDQDNITVKEKSLESATVVFEKEGLYTVGLTTHQDECTKVLTKQLKVLTPSFDHKSYNGATSFIKEFEIRPNPNDGHFEVMVSLQETAAVRLRFMNFYSNDDIAVQDASDQKDYIIPMHVSVPSGTYILLLETPYGTRITKVVIM